MRRLVALASLSLLAACGRGALSPLSPSAPCPDCEDGYFLSTDAGVESVASSPDAGVVLPCGNVPIGPDCCSGGARVASATCVDGAWSCGPSDFCTCAGVPQDFQCTDVCGSDAFLPPVCANGQWSCPRPTFETSLCSPDTCWGEPGDCCGAPSCVDGGWVCGFKPAGC